MIIPEDKMRYSMALTHKNGAKRIWISQQIEPCLLSVIIPPMSVLIGNSIELYLKSWLLNKNCDTKKVRKIGHDLHQLYNECVSYQFPTNNEVFMLVCCFGDEHKNHNFRYMESTDIFNLYKFEKVFFELDQLDDIVNRQVQAKQYIAINIQN